MSELRLQTEYILASPRGFRYVIKDLNDRVSCPEIKINYREIVEDEWITKSSIAFQHKDIKTLIKIFTTINAND